MARLDGQLERLEAASPPGAARCTGRATPPRRTHRRRRRPRDGGDEVVKVKSMATQEIGLNEALAAGGHHGPGDRPGRADRAARRRPALAHPGPRDPPQPGRDPGDLPSADARRGPRTLTDDPRGCAAAARPPAREVPRGEGRVPAPTSPSPRPARCRGRVRGQRADVPDTARDPDHGDGDREGRAHLGRPRGLPPAAAALLHRRADEPVHLDCGPGSPPATDRRRSTSSCSTTDAPARSPTSVGRQALHCIRCSACLNVCPVYERTGGHAYGSVYPGPIGAILTPQLTGTESEPDDSLPYASTPLRRVLRRLPGPHRHPRHAGPPARPPRRGARPPTGAVGRGHRDGRGRLGDGATGGSGRRTGRCWRVGRALGDGGGRITAPTAAVARWTAARDLPRPPWRRFATGGTARGGGS